MKFENLTTEAGLKALNAHLEDRSYVEGYTPSSADADVFAQLSAAPDAKFPHVLRWWNHINSYSTAERAAFPAPVTAAPAAAPATAAEKKPEQPKSADDDFDLFEQTEEDKAAIEAELKRKAEEAMKAAKAKGQARSQIVLDVKPWDDETPMDKLEQAVRAIEMDGLVWGEGKLVPVGYGIKKLRIIVVVVDELVSTDDLEERILAITDYVQSMDVQSFNKL